MDHRAVHYAWGLCSLLVALLAANGASHGPPARQGAPVPSLTIQAGDYYFRAPRSIPAGWTTIRLENHGPGFHHAVLLRLQAGQSRAAALTRILERRGDPDRAIDGTVSIGGPEGHMPSGDSFVSVFLEAGEYLIVCMIPLADGAPHAARGMYAPLTVTAAKPPLAAAPRADLVLRMTDYAYAVSHARVAAGWRTIRVDNAGGTEHIAEVARLKPGRSVEDVWRWFRGELPDSLEPVTTIGGSTRVATSGVSYMHLPLTPGHYVVYCMLQDQHRRPHVALGMFGELTVE